MNNYDDDDDDDLDPDLDAFDSIKFKHPELYGKLLEANAALQDAGGILIVPYLLVLLLGCAAIWLEWYKSVPELKEVNLNSFWIYAIIVLLVVSVWIGHFTLIQRSCYQKHRESILELVRKAGLRRYPFLALLTDDKSIADVTAALQRDRWDEFA